MNMHMFGVMYAPSERLTLMVMNKLFKKRNEVKKDENEWRERL